MPGSAVLCLILLLTGLLSGCSSNELELGPLSETRLMLDTFCTITIFGTADESLLTDALDLCAWYETLFSKTIAGSDVWQINYSEGEPVTVSPHTAEVIRIGLEYGALTDGMFDITIGRLSVLWDFGGSAVVPREEDIVVARALVDYRKVSLDGSVVRLQSPEVRLDLGGIAKGYIADRLAEFIMDGGAKGAVIYLGGDVVVAGERPDGAPWRIAVRDPFGSGGELLGVVETGAAAVVTSGIYERKFEENDVIYHHILDPFTGMPVRSDVVGVTVIAENALIGDVLSTSALLLGSERAILLFENAPEFIGALLVLEDGERLKVGEIAFETL